jgi:hypothetical protein
VTPLGAKGVAEGNAMSTPACIANAVADALGVPEISLPLNAGADGDESPAATRITLRPHDPGTGEEIEKREVVKGYEYSRGQFLTFTAEEATTVGAEPRYRWRRTTQIRQVVFVYINRRWLPHLVQANGFRACRRWRQIDRAGH